MVFGTFDILHKGHLNFFKQAKKHGDYLIAVVGRDKTVKKIKGKNPRNKEVKRLINVVLSKTVDLAVLGYNKDPYRIIGEYKPNVICLGYDQNSYTGKLKEELKKRKLRAKIIRLKPYKEHIYKSSKIRK
ncbi:adenylyltransferase/cytidyltransferase family protein [Candidatus Woesearchaeota archaeon]|nr:adenylyltransferase/cytidyltransferase family protein [Candidatus Woesearchaeota archaeon]